VEQEYLDYAEKMLGNYKSSYGASILFDDDSSKATFTILN